MEKATEAPGAAVSKDTLATEPASKQLQPETEDLEKGWETVEQPSQTASEKTTDVSEEGEKVEAPDLAGSNGEKIEKPEAKEVLKEEAVSGKVVPESTLAKDW